MADLPDDVLEEADEVIKKLEALRTLDEQHSRSKKVALRRKALLKVFLVTTDSLPKVLINTASNTTETSI